MFAYKTGCRKGEIANLRWNQIDRIQGVVTFNPGETKTDEPRTLYLDDELRDVIEYQWVRRRESERLSPYVFVNEDGTAAVGDFRKAWATACERANIGERLFHDFRRTAVRNMVRAGIPQQVAKRISGHRTDSTFARYNITDDADLRRASERVSAYLHERDKDKTRTILGFPKEKVVSDEAPKVAVSNELR
jgi:integrase